MYTKEDIEKAKQYLDNEGYGTGSNFTLNTVANLMAEYAAKNCVIPDVSKCEGLWDGALLLAFRDHLSKKYDEGSAFTLNDIADFLASNCC